MGRQQSVFFFCLGFWAKTKAHESALTDSTDSHWHSARNVLWLPGCFVLYEYAEYAYLHQTHEKSRKKQERDYGRDVLNDIILEAYQEVAK